MATGTRLSTGVGSITRAALLPVSVTRPTRPDGSRTGWPTATPCRLPAESTAVLDGEEGDPPTIRAAAIMSGFGSLWSSRAFSLAFSRFSVRARPSSGTACPTLYLREQSVAGQGTVGALRVTYGGGQIS